MSLAASLVGGWLLPEPFGGGGLNGGGLALDRQTRTLYCYVNDGNGGRTGVAVFDLPEHGAGPDLSQWPVLRAKAFIQPWWDQDNPLSNGAVCQGLRWGEGKLWSVTRDIYAATTAPTVVKAMDGERRVYPTLPRGAFGNFVKKSDGSYRLGCGGHESGTNHGVVNGPCLAELDGTVRITYASIPYLNRDLSNWNSVAPRPADYYRGDPIEDWLCWDVRDVDGDGILEGRWGSDHVDSGGLVFPDSIDYWTYQGTGRKSYLNQRTSASPVFADSWDLHRTRVYRYDPRTYQLLGYADWDDGFGGPMKNPIRGSDFGPADGTFVLLEANAHGYYSPAVRLYAYDQPTPPPPPPPDPNPVELNATFSTDLMTLRTGRPFGISSLAGAARVMVSVGGGGDEYGASDLLALHQPGDHIVSVIDADDVSRQKEYPAKADGPLLFDCDPPRLWMPPVKYRAFGINNSDNHLGICRPWYDPDGDTLDLLYFHADRPDWGTGRWGVTRTRGTYDDPLAYGEVHWAEIEGQPPEFNYLNPGNPLLMAGPVEVIKRSGKPDKLVMLLLGHEVSANNAGYTYASYHWAHSADYGGRWRYGGVAYRHVPTFAEWQARGWKDYQNYLHGGTGLLRIGGHIYIPLSQLNGPLYGPGGSPNNWCPLGWARVDAAVLADTLDAGGDVSRLTRKLFDGAWSSPFDGPATPVADDLGDWTDHVTWNYDLGLYLRIGQPKTVGNAGDAVYVSYARDILGPWSPRQLLFRYRKGPNWYCACPTFGQPLGVGREFDVLIETWTEGEGVTDNLVGWEAVRVRFPG